MSDSDSDYDVEQYLKPTVKRTTHEEEDDSYLSESDPKLSDEEHTDEEHTDRLKEHCIIPKKEQPTNIENHNDDNDDDDVQRSNNRFILHVSNISNEISKTVLEDFFIDAGEIKSVRIPRKRSFAFVEMSDIEGYKVNF